jgi:hypothetical protein
VINWALTPADSSQGYYADAVGDKDVLRYGLAASQSAPKYRRSRGENLKASTRLLISAAVVIVAKSEQEVASSV